MRETPLIQHLHPKNNSNERSPTSTYGVKAEECANNNSGVKFHSAVIYHFLKTSFQPGPSSSNGSGDDLLGDKFAKYGTLKLRITDVNKKQN